ncbi:ABC transporter permease [Citricoccus muralis]|uniref:ABC transporter permease n=1 Tax=Citricoccus muralis TaxID=169134 RepID=A0ABY8H882_9MICC|nr:ABC transporter permease [Citricoccus muralis]WFP17126.1 ABC transporter permease [Citricoccus muralis]
MNRKKLLRILPWITTPGLLIVLFVVWEITVKALDVSPLILPPPSLIFEGLGSVLGEASTWSHIRVTVIQILIGFTAGTFAGVVVGVLLGKLPLLEASVRPLIIALEVIPKVALIPLFVIWFGFGMTTKIIIAGLLAFFPVMLNVLLGVRSVDRGHRDVMQSINASRWQTFKHLEVKSMMPHVFAGMETAIVLAVIGTIVGEYLGGNEGLGYLVVRTLNELNAPALFAVILILATIGLIMYFTVNSLKRFVIPWHESVYGRRESA